MITQGPFLLSASSSSQYIDPSTNAVPASAVQVQNQTSFNLTVTTGSITTEVAPNSATTVPSFAQPITVTTGATGAVGNGMYLVWETPSDINPQADGPIVSSLSVNIGTVNLAPGTTVDIGNQPTVDIAAGATIDVASGTVNIANVPLATGVQTVHQGLAVYGFLSGAGGAAFLSPGFNYMLMSAWVCTASGSGQLWVQLGSGGSIAYLIMATAAAASNQFDSNSVSFPNGLFVPSSTAIFLESNGAGGWGGVTYAQA